MNPNLERTEVVVHGAGEYFSQIEAMSKHGSNVAIIAVCDNHISADTDGEDFSAVRHTYFVYHVPAPHEDYVSDVKELVKLSVSIFLGTRSSGIRVRAVWHQINVVRVQVIFGSNHPTPAFAEVICREALELRQSVKSE